MKAANCPILTYDTVKTINTNKPSRNVIICAVGSCGVNYFFFLLGATLGERCNKGEMVRRGVFCSLARLARGAGVGRHITGMVYGTDWA